MSLGIGASETNRSEKRFVREEVSTSKLRAVASTVAVALKQLGGTTIKKWPYLFLLYFESMYHKYLPCQILSHDFDEKSDFLNYEFSIRLPAITRFKNGLVQKRESWVEGGCDVIQSRHQNKRGYLSMHKRSARFTFYPSSCVFVNACLGEDYAMALLCFLDWITSQGDCWYK